MAEQMVIKIGKQALRTPDSGKAKVINIYMPANNGGGTKRDVTQIGFIGHYSQNCKATPVLTDTTPELANNERMQIASIEELKAHYASKYIDAVNAVSKESY